MSYYIKLFTEILDDIKLFLLPEFIKWRLIEFMLVAKEYNKDGLLPPVKLLALRLRLSEVNISETLSVIEPTGVVAMLPDGQWIIVNFAKRQASQDPTAKERMQKYRERNVTRNVTRIPSESASSSDSPSDSESLKKEVLEESLSARVFKAYTAEIGTLTSKISEVINCALEDYPGDWIIAAIEESARNNKRSWSYAEAILKRWKVDGFQSRNKNNGRNDGKDGHLPSLKVLQEWLEENKDDDES